jgi:hypothetical protein
MNLSYNTNLRELSLFLRQPTSLQYITSALAQIDASSIQKITIENMPDLYSDVVLTSAFQQLILKLGLTRLTLYAEKSDRPWIKERLPRLAKHGILRFAS